MMKLMSLEFPLSADIMTTVRLVTGGVCALAGFDLDGTEDCKVCVTESILLLSRGGAKNVRLSFQRADGLQIFLEGENCKECAERSVEEEISVALLNALVEDLNVQKEKDLTRISFGFKAL